MTTYQMLAAFEVLITKAGLKGIDTTDAREALAILRRRYS
jgi:hypothetical protein